MADPTKQPTPATDPTPAAPTPAKRRIENDAQFQARMKRREKSFKELSLPEMVDEIHNPDVDSDSETDDNAWQDSGLRVEYALAKIAEILRQNGLIS